MSTYADGAQAFAAGYCTGIMPDPPLWVDQWAAEHQRIPVDTGAAEPGRYHVERTPYARAVMQALSPAHPARRVAVKGASQMLKTQVALNAIMAWIDKAPSNILALEPSLNLAKRLSGRIDKNIKAVLANKVAAPRSRDSRNTLDTKEFPGGQLLITTAGSAANLAEVPVKYGYGDEIDRWEASVDSEGDPIRLFEARFSTHQRSRKIYYSSSPTIDGDSAIQEQYELGDQRGYFVACPHCGEHQVLEFEQLVWNSAHSAAQYVCIHHGCIIDESAKAVMLPDREMGGTAEWRPRAAGDGETVSFEISALYMPLGWISWTDLLKEYEAAKRQQDAGDPESMQVFYNTRLARTWNASLDKTTADELRLRAQTENYRLRTIPVGVLVLTAAVDVQDNRLEMMVIGWGVGMEWWVIDKHIIVGDPAVQATWDELDTHLLHSYAHPGGSKISITATAIDSGGHHTQEVYQFCRLRRHRNVWAVKGESKPWRPIIAARPSLVDVTWRGTTEKNGASLWMIGTDSAKDWLYNRFSLGAGPGAGHYSPDLLEGDFFEQLTAENKLRVWKNGVATVKFSKPKSARNEALDMAVYNLAMANWLGLHRFQPADWEKLAMRYAQTSLFAPPPDEPPPQQHAQDPAQAGFVASGADDGAPQPAQPTTPAAALNNPPPRPAPQPRRVAPAAIRRRR